MNRISSLLLAVTMAACGAPPDPAEPTLEEFQRANPRAKCNGWTSGPDLNEARLAHTMTLLPGGRILVTGGTSDAGAILGSTEIWDPATDAWTNGPSLSEARTGHAAHLLEDGRVLIVGGVGTMGQALATTELFDSTSDTMAAGPATSGAHGSPRVVEVPDGRLLLMNGDPAASAPTTDFFEPLKEIWRSPGEPFAQAPEPTLHPFDGTMVAVATYKPDGEPIGMEFWYNADTAGEGGEQFESFRLPGCVGQGHLAVRITGSESVLAGGASDGGSGCVALLGSGGPSGAMVEDNVPVTDAFLLGDGRAFLGNRDAASVLSPGQTKLETFEPLPVEQVRAVVRADFAAMTSGGTDGTSAVRDTYVTCEK